jgi:hypothetical protein
MKKLDNTFFVAVFYKYAMKYSQQVKQDNRGDVDDPGLINHCFHFGELFFLADYGLNPERIKIEHTVCGQFPWKID